ncbi:MAG: extracellular solute-binding protein [Lachnospiraceae bacterium]|nr:extracellular solute-binding protein [Lachnospiraceae bacterium]
MKKKKNKTRIRNICILAVLIVVAVVAYNLASSDEYADTRDAILAKYLSYEDTSAVTYDAYISQYAKAYVDNKADRITLKASQYSESDMSGLTEKNGVVWTQDTGSVTYEFNVAEAGLYYIQLTYYTDTSSTQTILRNVYVNGELPFDDCRDINVSRLWMDDNKNWLNNTKGNQAAPTQIQGEGPGIMYFSSNDCDTVGNYMFYFEKGRNTVTLESGQSVLGISEIALVPASEILTYERYLRYYTEEEGAEVVSANNVPDGAIVIQAEDASMKSSSSLSPNNDRTSVATEPYHATYIVYNTIGGESWASAGQNISWTVNVERAGLYKIGVRFKQYLNRGFYSARYLTVNGQLPFKEAAEVRFEYAPDWQTAYLGGEDGDYYFYLEKGENTISMTATLGELSEAVELVNQSVDNLNVLYRELTAVTGTDPDKYRDYQILTYVSDMQDVLEVEYTRLNAVVAMFGESMESANKTSSVVDMMNSMVKLIKRPDDVAEFLPDFNTKLSSLGEWVNSINNLPLELDYIMVAGDGYELPAAEGGFFANVAHTWNAFIGSFTNDFKVHNQDGDSEQKKEQLTVWVATDTRAQYDIIQKMINSHMETMNYEVNLSMVGGDTVLPATVAGEGPDLVLHSSYSSPTNFAYRKAAYDLTQFSDFEEIYKRFPADTRAFLEYEGGVYGLPDQLSFPVMIYRKDILDSMGLEVPETWEDLMGIIPYLEAENMSVYLASNEYMTLGGGTSSTTIPVNSIFLSMLYQKGYSLYNADYTKTRMDEVELMKVFKEWTEYYTNQGLSYSINLSTRFRTGEVPVAVVDYTYVNTLNVSAPEIAGKWSIAKMPGTLQADGTVDHSAACMIATCFIVSSTVEKDGMAEEAWDFLKWWTSEETQENYSTELKAENGEAAEFPVANMNAIKNGGLNEEFKQVVISLLDDLRAEPQVPGGYITGRVIRNAFTSVVTNNTDPVDTLYILLDDINKEITSKRTEFGLHTAE